MKKIFIVISTLFIFYLGIAILGHAAQIAEVAERISAGSGGVVFWGLVAVLYGGPLVVLGMFLRLPKPLIPPETNVGPEYDSYLKKLGERLQTNPLINSQKIESEADVATALTTLSKHANQVIKDTASTVFVSTSVLQNGRLDGLIVLATQLRLVWRISRIYYQRPSPRQLISLYGNISANMLIADSIQEIDFEEISAPIVTSVLPSLKGAIPGLQGITSLLVNSMANGTANAFLTLRIGICARLYCEALTKPSPSLIKSSATAQAFVLVKEIAREQGVSLARKVWETVKGMAVSTTEHAVENIKVSTKKAVDATTNSASAAKKAVVKGYQNVSDKVKRPFGAKGGANQPTLLDESENLLPEKK